MLTVTDIVFWLPALSVATAFSTEVPWAVICWAGGQIRTPLSGSVHVKVMVTGVELMPKLSGAGLSTAAIVGAVLSRLIVTLVFAWLAARSMAVPLTIWFAPS